MTMQLEISLDRNAETSLYKQISGRIVDRIEAGYLPQGSRLPTIRDLSDQLGVTRVTVQNAYSDLQERGWVEATVGRGTFVTGPQPSDPLELVSAEISPASIMRDMGRLGRIRGMRTMAMAEPDPELHPSREFLQELHGVTRHGTGLFDYACSLGSSTLRHQLAALVGGLGIDAKPELIQVTSGATQALALITDALADSGDTVLVEQPTYLGLLAILQARGIRPVGVPLDAEGPDLEALEALVVRERPQFFYTVPDFQNPTGVSMAPGRRLQLLEISRRHRLRIVEDAVYHMLAYDGPVSRPLKADDEEGLVIYADSFSKSLLPGLRVGFVIAPPDVHETIRRLFEVNELCGQPLIHQALAQFLDKGRYEQHLREVTPEYRTRRDAMLEALDEHMPDDVSWTRPGGGFCCWLTLPDEGRFDDLYPEALQQRIAYTPGEVFNAEPGATVNVRLCFSNVSTQQIRGGILDLSDLVQKRLLRRPGGEIRHHEMVPLI